MRQLFNRILRRTRRFLLAKGIIRAGKDREVLKWGIVGTGHMAKRWADLLLESRVGTLHAVCSRSAAKADQFGRSFGCMHRFDQLEKMLENEAENLDFVYVATPLGSHGDIIRMCIEAGVNVLTEKPATPNPDLWAELVSLAKQRGVLLVEGMWMRCLPTFRQADAWIEEGEIGHVSKIRVDFHKFVPPSSRNVDADTGVLMDFGVYALYFASHFLGGVPDELDSSHLKTKDSKDSDWSIVARKNGRTAILNVSSTFRGTSRAAVFGDTGMIEWGGPFNRTNEVVLYSYQSDAPVRKSFAYRNEGFEFQLEEVTRAAKQRLPESALLKHGKTLDALKFAELLQGENVGARKPYP